MNGKIDIIKFWNKFVVINFEDDSENIKNKKLKKKILILLDWKLGLIFDFNINKRESVIRKIM